MEQVPVLSVNMSEAQQIEQKKVLENIQCGIAFGAVAAWLKSAVSNTPSSPVRSWLAVSGVMETPQRFG